MIKLVDEYSYEMIRFEYPPVKGDEGEVIGKFKNVTEEFMERLCSACGESDSYHYFVYNTINEDEYDF